MKIVVMNCVLAVLLAAKVQGLFWKPEADTGPTSEHPNDYGVDVSFPIHHPLKPSLNSANPIKRMFAKGTRTTLRAATRNTASASVIAMNGPGWR